LDNSDKPKKSDERAELDRRSFVKILGSGLLITVSGTSATAQQASNGNVSDAPDINARVHIDVNGDITVMTGKVELGQGSRTEISQVAAEELRVRLENIRLIMGDTDLTPDDGHTGSSLTTPRTVPKVRETCAAARKVLIEMAAAQLHANPDELQADNGTIVNRETGQSVTYGELASTEKLQHEFTKGPQGSVAVTPVAEWKVMGKPTLRIHSEDLVTGRHQYSSDITRPNMLYGKVLFPPAYGATLTSIDLSHAEAMAGVQVVRDGNFVGVTAPASHLAEQAVAALGKTAQWKTPSQQPSSSALFSYLKDHVKNERTIKSEGSVQDGLKHASETLTATFTIAHIQHATLEPRAAVAEWHDGRVTIWTGTASPRRVRKQVATEISVSEDDVRILVPDTGGHYCGKHTGEAAVQAARLARGVQQPVSVRWTRQEDFTWAYFRWAGLVEMTGGLDDTGHMNAWQCTNYNAGNSAIAPPYQIPNVSIVSKKCQSPLTEGSYRAVAAPANVFVRESFMDELALAAKADPLEFRLRHIHDDRLRTVLETATRKFGWSDVVRQQTDTRGFGLACATEKGSHVTTCVEVEIDHRNAEIQVVRLSEVFECGAIINPFNLQAQVEGAIVMGMGGALWEEIQFDSGVIRNASFKQYRVPRFKDVPRMDITLLDRPDITSTGAGETPLITIAPAIGNAVFAATGTRIRSMPMKYALLRQ